MRHGVDHKKLGRGTAHRMAMFSNMAGSLLKHGRIETTVDRAKELRRIVEKLITKGKVDSVHRRRLVRSIVKSPEIVKILFEQVAPRFISRNGGYTRILKKSTSRMGDAAEMAFIEFVDYVLPKKKVKSTKKSDKEELDEKELEKQAVAAGKAHAGIKSASSKKDTALKSTSVAGGPKKSTTVRKTSGSS